MITAESVIGLADEAKALPVILTGVLDGKIAQVKALLVELKERQGIVATMDAAEAEFSRNKALIDDHSQRAMETINAASAAASTLMDQANAKMTAATQREQSSLAVQELINQAQHETAERAAEVGRLRDDLNSKASGLAQRATDLDKREAKLRADQAVVNARLDALKV